MNELAPASQWILNKYIELENNLEKHLQDYELAHSVDSLENFLWDDYANWYVEYLKTDDSQIPFAKELYKQFIITASPYVPFETQALWEEFFGEKTLLANQKKDSDWGREYATENFEEFELIKSVVEKLRSLRGLFAIDPAKRIVIYSDSELLQKYAQYLGFIAKCDVEQTNGEKLYEVKFGGDLSFGIDILSYVAYREFEINKTNKEIISLQKQIEGLENKLNNPKFVENASEEIKKESQDNLRLRQIELENQQEKLEVLSS